MPLSWTAQAGGNGPSVWISRHSLDKEQKTKEIKREHICNVFLFRKIDFVSKEVKKTAGVVWYPKPEEVAHP